MERKKLSLLFKNFALKECNHSSPLYKHLSLKVAEDTELLANASHARRGQPVPNPLFGAVHYLLLKGKNHPLRSFYPSLVDIPKKAEDAFPDFRDFCLSFKEEIVPILQEKIVQTNEIGRCAYLYPSFCLIYSRVKKPLSIIEIGTSAGLQLLWDHYRYSYGKGKVYGYPSANIQIDSEIQGSRQPFLLPESPPVAFRLGVDLHINDLSDQENFLWMRSLIWPEHKKRVKLFEKAAQQRKKHPLQLIEGDAVEILPRLSDKIPENTGICIFHTHVANQIPDKAKLKLMNHIELLGKNNDVFHLYNNMHDRDHLHLDSYIHGKKSHEVLARTDGHGRWFEWRPMQNPD